jgi:hypothetical protein
VTEALLDGPIAGEQAKLGSIDARTKQLVDRRLEVFRVMKDADHLADRFAISIELHDALLS